MANQKSQSDLRKKIEDILKKYNPFEIQCELANQYMRFVKLVEPDYHYIPPEGRKKGEPFVEPASGEARYWLKNWRGSANLCRGMEKWLDEMVDELEEESEAES